MTLLSMILGFQWLSFILNIVFDLTSLIKFLTNSTNIFMGLTIIAITNTCIDLFMNSILSKNGYEIMAITGIFAGQMFNFLVGFSISGIFRFILGEKDTFNIFSFNNIFDDQQQIIIIILIILSVITLVYNFIVLKMNK